MSIKLNRNLKSTIKFVVTWTIVLLIIKEFPSVFQTIWDCGKDFGSNITKFILSLI